MFSLVLPPPSPLAECTHKINTLDGGETSSRRSESRRNPDGILRRLQIPRCPFSDKGPSATYAFFLGLRIWRVRFKARLRGRNGPSFRPPRSADPATRSGGAARGYQGKRTRISVAPRERKSFPPRTAPPLSVVFYFILPSRARARACYYYRSLISPIGIRSGAGGH